MKKRILILFVLVAMVFGLFTACGDKNGTITAEKAQKIALKDAGLSAGKVDDIHVHATSFDGVPCYEIHIVDGNLEMTYYIAAKGGEILHVDDAVDGH